MAVKATNSESPSAILKKRVDNLAKSVGLKPKFVREKFLPEWWDESSVVDEDGLWEASVILAKTFGAKPSEVIAKEGMIVPSNALPHLCKGTTAEQHVKELPSTIIASRLASIASIGCKPDFTGIPQGPLALRQELLQGCNRITFEVMVEYCWRHGIPVLAVKELPPNRPDGFVFKCNDRPVIVLCRDKQYSGWLLFDLAHELGHVALGHLDDNPIVDSINPNTHDSTEGEANDFAFKLLLGENRLPFYFVDGVWKQYDDLARSYAAAYKVDAQWLLVAAGWKHRLFGLVNYWLGKLTDPDSPKGIIRRFADRFIDQGPLKESERSILVRLLP